MDFNCRSTSSSLVKEITLSNFPDTDSLWTQEIHDNIGSRTHRHTDTHTHTDVTTARCTKQTAHVHSFQFRRGGHQYPQKLHRFLRQLVICCAQNVDKVHCDFGQVFPSVAVGAGESLSNHTRGDKPHQQRYDTRPTARSSARVYNPE
jgi:hypothetical protein